MNPEYLARMSAKELDSYAQVIGVDVSNAKTCEDKQALIAERYGRCAVVPALGIKFRIPFKRVHDKRITDLLTKDGRTDEETEQAMRLLLGDEQLAELVEACTDTDGTIDVQAMALAFATIITSDELKNC